jgi:ferric-dicitrate binding protein FerR (iron transport regulator)
MFKQSEKELIDRYIKGVTNPEEDQYIDSLFSDNEEIKEFEEFIRSDWERDLEISPSGNQDLSYLLDRIHHQVHIREKRRERGFTRRFYRWYSMAAAILLIPLLLAGGFWFFTRETGKESTLNEHLTATLYAPLGSRLKFDLPDGTQGWLNSESSLEYNLPFSQNRKVVLSGEGFFDVFPDERYPFEIAAGKAGIKVLGTKFNVSAYPSENYVEVVIEKGKVEFYCSELSSPVVMKPANRLVYNREKIVMSVTDASKYSGWTEGKLIFRGDPMSEVARRIERWYNVKVEVADKELEGYVFRGTFQDDSLEEVLRLLSLTSPIRYRIIDRKMLDNNDFEKKKVLLYLKK